MEHAKKTGVGLRVERAKQACSVKPGASAAGQHAITKSLWAWEAGVKRKAWGVSPGTTCRHKESLSLRSRPEA